MRCAPLIIVSLGLSNVFALPFQVQSTGLVRRTDPQKDAKKDTVRLSSAEVRKYAEDNIGRTLNKGEDAGHVWPVQAADELVNDNEKLQAKGVTPGNLSQDAKIAANKQVANENSGANRAAGRQEAKNVQKILNNEHPDQKVNAEHRDYQKAHKDLGMHHALEFKEAVKDAHGVEVAIEPIAEQMIDQQHSKDAKSGSRKGADKGVGSTKKKS